MKHMNYIENTLIFVVEPFSTLLDTKIRTNQKQFHTALIYIFHKLISVFPLSCWNTTKINIVTLFHVFYIAPHYFISFHFFTSFMYNTLYTQTKRKVVEIHVSKTCHVSFNVFIGLYILYERKIVKIYQTRNGKSSKNNKVSRRQT